ncbi:hypothetical protein RA307_00615 [Xanthobacteraceae bacterium Astr-EGSB]|uniref:hypothetical protein n=1 Tax=Astrobacterium formosum TaxID=3069710 RepID=UPI0027AE77C9|nr:hypothetical protein [Xanthobacteraceae bacterium Astr-EGSB]
MAMMSTLRTAFRATWRLALGAVVAITLAIPSPAMAQSKMGSFGKSDCALYQKAMAAPDGVSRELLKDWPRALSCLIDMLGELDAAITSVDAVSGRGDLLAIVKAIRVVLDENDVAAIRRFRETDTIAVASVLTFAARVPDGAGSVNRDIRLNATLILGNVIDNSSVCVPIDHLYDPKINPNGRANLLAVVSVVAPWAYKPNADNISRMLEFTKLKLDPSFADTRRIVTDLDTKNSARQLKAASEPSSADAEAVLAPCRAYKAKWADGQLKY